jgi:hypothetical protein
MLPRSGNHNNDTKKIILIAISSLLLVFIPLAQNLHLLGIVTTSSANNSVKAAVENKYYKDLALPTTSTTSTTTSTTSTPAKGKGGDGGEEEQQRNAATLSFLLSTGNTELQEAYDLALSEIGNNIHPSQKYFIAGAGWTQLWTRDTSYAVELGAGLIHPDTSISSLHTCTEHVKGIGTVWLQDVCGHFGGWYVLISSYISLNHPLLACLLVVVVVVVVLSLFSSLSLSFRLLYGWIYLIRTLLQLLFYF